MTRAHLRLDGCLLLVLCVVVQHMKQVFQRRNSFAVSDCLAQNEQPEEKAQWSSVTRVCMRINFHSLVGVYHTLIMWTRNWIPPIFINTTSICYVSMRKHCNPLDVLIIIGARAGKSGGKINKRNEISSICLNYKSQQSSKLLAILLLIFPLFASAAKVRAREIREPTHHSLFWKEKKMNRLPPGHFSTSCQQLCETCRWSFVENSSRHSNFMSSIFQTKSPS